MTDQQLPAPTPEQTAAPALPVQHPFHELAYESVMTRIKAANLKPLFNTFAIALGLMALGNVVMFALVQQAQQETVDFAARIAANSESGGEFQDGDAASAEHLATFGPLADLIDSIKEKERRRDALLAQRPEYAGNLPIANAPDWRALAAQQLRAYDDQVDAQIAILARQANVASADSIAPSSLDAPMAAPAFSLPLPTPSAAFAKPAPVKQAVAKPSAPKRAVQSAAAKRAADSNYARELTAALNRAARDQAPAPAGTIGEAEPAATPAPAPAAAPVALDVAPISTAAPVAPEAITSASDELSQ